MHTKALLIFIAVLLTSCGGGSGGSSEKPSSSFSSKINHSPSSISSSASSSSPSGEAINGHAVPPEPDPTLNNSTLEGMDVNANGVRDDVERVIAREAKSEEAYKAEIYVASKISNIMDFKKNANSVVDDIDCSSYRYPDVDQIRLFDLYLNTEDRINRYSDWKYSTVKVLEITENDIGWNGADLCK